MEGPRPFTAMKCSLIRAKGLNKDWSQALRCGSHIAIPKATITIILDSSQHHNGTELAAYWLLWQHDSLQQRLFGVHIREP